MADAERDDLVAAYVDLVEDVWVRGGMSSRARRRLCVELEQDLAAALDAGAPAVEVFSAGPAHLARDVAAAAGVSLTAAGPVLNRGGLVARGLAGAVVSVAFVWFFALPSLADVLYADGDRWRETVSVVLIYAVCFAIVLGGAAVSMGSYLRETAEWRAMTVRATVLMGALGVLGVPVCIGIGVLSNYSTAPVVVLLYLLIVGGLSAVGIAVAWRGRPVAIEQVFE